LCKFRIIFDLLILADLDVPLDWKVHRAAFISELSRLPNVDYVTAGVCGLAHIWTV